MSIITIHKSTDLFSTSGLRSINKRRQHDWDDNDRMDEDADEYGEHDDEDDDDNDDDDDHERVFSLNTGDGNGELGGGNSSSAGGVVKGRHIVTPGELVTADPVWMRGHGTYAVTSTSGSGSSSRTYSSVAGTITRVNKLLSVAPLRGRYVPEVGDHVVGRILDVGPRSWHVDIGAKQAAVLMLGSVNLPGGVQRRKSESDELQMRQFLKEGDLLNAEVQAVFTDGAASLHTRSLSYGKLRNGYFLTLHSSSLVVRSKAHAFSLPGGVDLVLGVNGYLFLRKHTQQQLPSGTTATTGQAGNLLSDEAGWEIYSDTNEFISPSVRDTITRYANVIKALEFAEVGVNESRIVSGFEASLEFKTAGEMVSDEAKRRIAWAAFQQSA
ncbi:hypothetical protein V1514DRAFT_325153 [Lipomyces japonicus]|uniref:uncharacterized protein n=1 Tax=Lipomyces japonicus TaxID=56871 RepID=UPI0034CE6369